jgi:hypothetical protein
VKRKALAVTIGKNVLFALGGKFSTLEKNLRFYGGIFFRGDTYTLQGSTRKESSSAGFELFGLEN